MSNRDHKLEELVKGLVKDFEVEIIHAFYVIQIQLWV